MQRKKHIRDNFNYEMANVLQNAYRGYRARGLVLEMKRERAAVVRVQSGIRCSLAKTLVSEKREQRRAAIKLQSRARMGFAEKEASGKRRCKQAAVTIQSRLRRMKALELVNDIRAKRLLKLMDTSAIRIQCIARKRQACLYVKELYRIRDSILEIKDQLKKFQVSGSESRSDELRRRVLGTQTDSDAPSIRLLMQLITLVAGRCHDSV